MATTRGPIQSRPSRRRSSRKMNTTTKVPVSVNSYMLPHGTRLGSAAMPAADQGHEVQRRSPGAAEQQTEPPGHRRAPARRPRRAGADASSAAGAHRCQAAAGADGDLARSGATGHVPQRRPLHEVGEQRQEVEQPRGRDRLVAQRLPRLVGHGFSFSRLGSGNPRRAATTSATSASTSPPSDRSRPATSTGVSRRVLAAGPHPHPPGPDEQRRQQPDQGEHDAGQRDLHAGGPADLDAVPALHAVEADASPRRSAARRSGPAGGRRGTSNRRAWCTRSAFGLVEHVDRLRRAVVHAQVAGVGLQRERRVLQVADHVERVAVDAQVRRVEEALEPDLRRLRRPAP